MSDHPHFPEHAADTLRHVATLQERTRRVLRSNWAPAALWALLCLVSTLWLVVGGSGAVFRPGADVDSIGLVQLGRSYQRLFGYWTVALPVGIAGSLILYRRAALRPNPPKPSLWYAPVVVATALAVPIAIMALEGRIYPLHGPAGWFPWIALTTLVIAWLDRVWVLGVVSVLLLAFSAAWHEIGTPALGLLPAAFTLGYAGTAVALRWQMSRS